MTEAGESLNCATPDCGNHACRCLGSKYCLRCYQRMNPGMAANFPGGCIYAEAGGKLTVRHHRSR
jgi:hypothetical protein